MSPEDITQQARKELMQEEFRKAVDAEKARIRARKSRSFVQQVLDALRRLM